jgi:Outer membrane lipoprotein carrier protein LolA-like
MSIRGRAVLWMLCCIALPAAAVLAAPATDTLDQLMALLGQRQHGHVTFTEVHTSSILDRPLESSGEMFYDAPDRVEKRTLKPKPESMLLEKGQLTLERRRKQYHVALADYPQAVPYIEAIRATLSGDRAALERWFRVTYSDSGAHWILKLVPLEPKAAAEVTEVSIDGALDEITTVTVQLANGDRSVTTLHEAPTAHAEPAT